MHGPISLTVVMKVRANGVLRTVHRLRMKDSSLREVYGLSSLTVRG